MPEPYDVDDTLSNRNRLKSAARRGDERATATLEHLDQAKHEARWQATDDAREAAAEARRQHNANRPGSVEQGRERLKKAREDKQAKQQADREAAKKRDAGTKSTFGW